MTKQYIDKLIDEKLNGERDRVVELFDSDAIFDELNENSELNDWLHFEPKTYDGDYLVKEGESYLVYLQERGRIMAFEKHGCLKDAAQSFFRGIGYIENT
jgi:hypothetical protein